MERSSSRYGFGWVAAGPASVSGAATGHWSELRSESKGEAKFRGSGEEQGGPECLRVRKLRRERPGVGVGPRRASRVSLACLCLLILVPRSLCVLHAPLCRKGSWFSGGQSVRCRTPLVQQSHTVRRGSTCAAEAVPAAAVAGIIAVLAAGCRNVSKAVWPKTLQRGKPIKTSEPGGSLSKRKVAFLSGSREACWQRQGLVHPHVCADC